MPTIRTPGGAAALLVVIWLGVIALGLRSLMIYAYTPGPTAPVQASWPPAAGAFPGEGSWLVMFVHPHCPCSKASIDELASLVAQAPGRLRARVYVELPDGMAAGWERGELWDLASAIPGAEVITDPRGVAASAFQAQVSGQALLYGADQRLVFSGGITPARGHRGDSDGRRAVRAHLAGGSTNPVVTPVFGCYLQSEPAADPALLP